MKFACDGFREIKIMRENEKSGRERMRRRERERKGDCMRKQEREREGG